MTWRAMVLEFTWKQVKEKVLLGFGEPFLMNRDFSTAENFKAFGGLFKNFQIF